MNKSKLSQFPATARSEYGFSLIEVVLAIGIFLVTVLALVGMLGPTLQSVDEVEKTDEIASVVNTVNAFLQSSPDIGNSSATPPESKFDAIYNAVENNGYATVFVFRSYENATSTNIELIVGFLGETNARLSSSDFANTAGSIYRIVLTASSVTPDAQLNETKRNADGIYTLKNSLATYPEGYFAMELRIFALEADIIDARGGSVPADRDADWLTNLEPLFTYNTAVVR
jgi:type II secretory pathway pseudopilin PulG